MRNPGKVAQAKLKELEKRMNVWHMRSGAMHPMKLYDALISTYRSKIRALVIPFYNKEGLGQVEIDLNSYTITVSYNI